MPTQLGDFRLLREAGRGGMGVVFEAIEIPLNRRVAVKVLDQRVVSDAVALQRFEREARAAATLHHTNIVPVFAIGSDIKPANLMLTADKTLCVMDFGLARFNEQNDLTATGEILGTPRYLAPERLSGQHTIQGDLYGLGVVLYELLTLRTAFDATDRVELLQQIVSLEPVAPRIINPRIPRDLETIVQKCLEKNVAQRYQHSADLAQDLRLFLDDRPMASRRASRWELALRWCRRSPGIASLLASVVVLLVVIAVGALFWARSLRIERDIAREAGREF